MTNQRMVPGLRLRFPGTNQVLRIGTPEVRRAPITLQRVGSFWRLPEQPIPFQGSKKGARVLVRNETLHQDLSQHAIMAAEIWVVEAHSASNSIDWRWENQKSSDRPIEKHSGLLWIMADGARLLVGVLPRNLIDHLPTASRPPSGGGNPTPEAIDLEDGVLDLQRMVGDLIGEQVRGSEEHGVPGMAVAVDPMAVLECPEMRLHRLYGLLREGGVLDTWDALLADPIVRLEEEFPIRPLVRANNPVWGGSRGPWSVAGGWSTAQPSGRVHDRIVTRTADTPVNRLAVQLAGRVRQVLEQIGDHLSTSTKGSCSPYYILADELLRRTVAVERAPTFAQVDRTATVPFETPSLQANRRAQPLLKAWASLDRATAPRPRVPLEEVLLDPLKQTHVLYELWCGARLRSLLHDKCQAHEPVRSPQGWRMDRFRLRNHSKITLGVTMDGQAEESHQRGGMGQSPLKSWGLPARPDGFLLLEPPHGRAPMILVLWDAKYRRITYSSYLSGATYQAHAFRDCVRYILGKPNRTTGEVGTLKAAWSLVFHPTRSRGQPVPKRFLLREGKLLSRLPKTDQDGTGDLHEFETYLKECQEYPEECGGVAILLAQPRGNDDSSCPIHNLVAQIVAYLTRESNQ